MKKGDIRNEIVGDVPAWTVSQRLNQMTNYINESIKDQDAYIQENAVKGDPGRDGINGTNGTNGTDGRNALEVKPFSLATLPNVLDDIQLTGISYNRTPVATDIFSTIVYINDQKKNFWITFYLVSGSGSNWDATVQSIGMAQGGNGQDGTPGAIQVVAGISVYNVPGDYIVMEPSFAVKGLKVGDKITILNTNLVDDRDNPYLPGDIVTGTIEEYNGTRYLRAGHPETIMNLKGYGIDSITSISHEVVGNETITHCQVNYENRLKNPTQFDVHAQNGANGRIATIPFISITDVPPDATSGTITDEQASILNSNKNEAFIMFHDEKFYPQDIADEKGYRIYTHHGETQDKTEIVKMIYLTLSTNSWVMSVSSKQQNLYIHRISIVFRSSSGEYIGKNCFTFIDKIAKAYDSSDMYYIANKCWIPFVAENPAILYSPSPFIYNDVGLSTQYTSNVTFNKATLLFTVGYGAIGDVNRYHYQNVSNIQIKDTPEQV